MIKKILIITTIGILSSGCATHYAYKSNHKKVERLKVYETGDPKIIQAYNNGDVVGLGIDLTSIDVIFNDFGTFTKQLFAGLLDAGLAYGAYEAFDSIDNGGRKSSDAGTGNTINSGGDTIFIVNNRGDGNDQSVETTDDSEFFNE